MAKITKLIDHSTAKNIASALIDQRIPFSVDVINDDSCSFSVCSEHAKFISSHRIDDYKKGFISQVKKFIKK